MLSGHNFILEYSIVYIFLKADCLYFEGGSLTVGDVSGAMSCIRLVAVFQLLMTLLAVDLCRVEFIGVGRVGTFCMSFGITY